MALPADTGDTGDTVDTVDTVDTAQPGDTGDTRPHGRRPMVGRRPDERHRSATPLELLYDLTIVVAFSVSGSQAAHALAAGHIATAVVAFLFSVFAIVWAWIGFTWFASAYDNDDWVMRVATLVQMGGVVVLALGLGPLYRGFEHWRLDNEVMIAGYVVMRLSMVFLWLRAARHNADRRASLHSYATLIVIAQVGWTMTTLVDSWFVLLPLLVALYALEVGGVVWVERRARTPWHPHHIAERYSLLVIISLGEVILGTTTAVEALVDRQGWTWNAGLVVAAGVSMAFGMWWCYFALPTGEVLERRPKRGFGFGYGHLPLFGAVAAVGAGLHVAAYWVEGETVLSEGQVVLTVALPLAAFVAMLFGLAHHLLPGRDRFHAVLLAATIAVIAVAVALGYTEAPLGWSLVVLMIVPWITVAGYETRGHGHIQRRLAEL